jgi:hypothetical protein
MPLTIDELANKIETHQMIAMFDRVDNYVQNVLKESRNVSKMSAHLHHAITVNPPVYFYTVCTPGGTMKL